MVDLQTKETDLYDIVICGGGLAGLSLARQLRMMNADWSILVLDRLKRPLPEITFKVGESSTEIGSHYLGHVLGLEEYIEEQHLEKLGLRYFYKPDQVEPALPGQSRDDLSAYAELGLYTYPPAKSYQVERGKLETHLRNLVVEDGVTLLEGVQIRDIDIRDMQFGDMQSGDMQPDKEDEPHVVRFRHMRGEKGEQSVRARWVVDATGRRRYLQKKFNLTKRFAQKYSAAWFRLDGLLDVEDWVPDAEIDWHNRVDRNRWHSTNHFFDKGYWMWMIPLTPGQTSVGIVAAEAHHPFDGYNTLARATEWLNEHEPLLARHMETLDMLDFKTMRNFTYSSHQVFSAERWSCVGEAGTFADPYYSIGLNMIAFANCFAAKQIELYFRGELTEEFVEHANRFYLSLNESLTHNLQLAYEYYDKPFIFSLKTLWDFCFGWSITDPQFYNDVYLDPKTSRLVARLINPIVVTQARIMELFVNWAEKTQNRFAFTTIDYLDDLPTWRDQLVRNLPAEKKNLRQVLDLFKYNVDRIEELAHALFILAVEDTMPEKMHLFEARPWLNTSALSLDSDRWEADGLFEPKTPPRDYTTIEQELRSLYTVQQNELVFA